MDSTTLRKKTQKGYNKPGRSAGEQGFKNKTTCSFSSFDVGGCRGRPKVTLRAAASTPSTSSCAAGERAAGSRSSRLASGSCAASRPCAQLKLQPWFRAGPAHVLGELSGTDGGSLSCLIEAAHSSHESERKPSFSCPHHGDLVVCGLAESLRWIHLDKSDFRVEHSPAKTLLSQCADDTRLKSVALQSAHSHFW